VQTAPPPWSAETKFSADMGDFSQALADVRTNGYPSDATRPVWLTAFEDNTWPGGTEDLYFSASGDVGEVRPPPIIRHRIAWIWIPSDLVLALGVVCFLLIRRRKRKQKGESQAG
jgi:hypothetical protein